MDEEQKQAIINRVINAFDFETAHSIMWLTKKHDYPVPTVEEMKTSARKNLMRALDHQERHFWWIGGLSGHGGMTATWDDRWGLSLHYVATSSRVRIKEEQM